MDRGASVIGRIESVGKLEGVLVYKTMHRLALRLGDEVLTQMRGFVRLAEIKYPKCKEWAVPVPDLTTLKRCL